MKNAATLRRQQPQCGDLIPYAVSQFPLGEIFLQRVREASRKAGKTEPRSLDHLHEQWRETELSTLYAALYALEDEVSFLKTYRALLKEVVAPSFEKPLHFQKKPGIRIQVPKSKTVQYHTDEWYGHGKDVKNFWMPLTNATGSNTLHLATREDSHILAKRMEDEKRSMPEINQFLSKACKPCEMSPGQILLFDATCVHGTETNETGLTRLSLDFRAVEKGGQTGSKNLDHYYGSIEGSYAERLVSHSGRRIATYFDRRHGIGRVISSDHQRLIVREFVHRHGLAALAEEMEIQTMSHHPCLHYLAQGKGTHDLQGVVLFSVWSLPDGDADRKAIYDASRESKVSLYFANENLIFPDLHQESQIEAARK